MHQEAFDLITARLARLIALARGGQDAYLTALVLLQQSLREVGLEELDGFLFVVAATSLAFKLTDHPRDLNDLVRSYIQMVRQELGKAPSPREEQHFRRVLARAKTEEVMILIRNKFNLNIEVSPIPLEPCYLKTVAGRVLNQVYRTPACLLLDGKALSELAVHWAGRMTNRDILPDAHRNSPAEAQRLLEEWFTKERVEYLLSSEYREAGLAAN